MSAGGLSPHLDWSLVSDDLVRDTLTTLATEERMAARWDGLSPIARRIHWEILRHFSSTGAAPGMEGLVRLSGQSAAEIRTLLADLDRRDLVVIEDGHIAIAYPFSDRPTRHRVRIGEVPAFAVCVIDGLGTAAMLGRAVALWSDCPICDTPIAIEVGSDGLTVTGVDPVTALVSARATETGGCAADTQCPTMLAFCGRQHFLDWRASDERVRCLSPAQAAQAGAAIFARFLR